MKIISDTKKSRAEYMRKRRAEKYSFSCLIDKEHGKLLKNHLKEKNQTKTDWLIEKIDNDTTK